MVCFPKYGHIYRRYYGLYGDAYNVAILVVFHAVQVTMTKTIVKMPCKLLYIDIRN